ncbi:MAG: hypothetical protein R3A49_14330 [Acidimicrobiia bacterium]
MTRWRDREHDQPLIYVDDPCGPDRLLEAGFRVVAGIDLPDRPFDVSDARVACVESVRDTGEGVRCVLAATRGASLAINVRLGAHDREALLDELAGIGHVIDGSAESTAQPSETRPSWAPLLDEMAAGDSVAGAARKVGVSRRTAYRLLEAARDALGVDTNTSAIVTHVRTEGARASGERGV